jgi:hypothetical protein
MTRPIGDLIRDFENDPTQWQVIRTDVIPSTNIRNKGGSSVQELLKHKGTGEEMIRHTLLKPDGAVFGGPHFRPNWK